MELSQRPPPGRRPPPETSGGSGRSSPACSDLLGPARRLVLICSRAGRDAALAGTPIAALRAGFGPPSARLRASSPLPGRPAESRGKSGNIICFCSGLSCATACWPLGALAWGPWPVSKRGGRGVPFSSGLAAVSLHARTCPEEYETEGLGVRRDREGREQGQQAGGVASDARRRRPQLAQRRTCVLQLHPPPYPSPPPSNHYPAPPRLPRLPRVPGDRARARRVPVTSLQ